MKFSFKWLVMGLLGLIVLAAIPVILAITLVYPRLPDLTALTDYHPHLPLRVFTSDGSLIGEFGEERRALVHIDQVPKLMKEAILAAEDDRFYQHHGIDFMGVARAMIANLVAGGAREGASTITMQVARNFFLSSEKTMMRKISEAMLSWKIEHELTKDQILELYINQIYLGQRAYGFEAAAETYFGKRLDQLNVAEMAVLAGLPKAPSRYNPVVNLPRAIARQHYVLKRMHDLHDLTDAQYQQALATHLKIKRTRKFEVEADYVAEMVRQAMYEQYGDKIYTSGLNVYTTLKSADQKAARQALVDGVIAYDRRHGWRGPEGTVSLGLEDSRTLEDQLDSYSSVATLLPAVVLEASPKRVKVYAQGEGKLEISGDGLSLVRRALAAGSPHRLQPGAVIRVVQDAHGAWEITQLPQVESALVSLDPKDGAILALVGGFDYNRAQFNHATQAWRQPGSSFKPFIYSAAMAKGYTPDSVFDDDPIALPDGNGGVWRPQNYEGDFLGPIPLKEALAKSVNVVAVKLLQAIGVDYASKYITRFGFSPDKNPPYLTLALGVGSVTPMQMANAYAIFANWGWRINPYFVSRVEDSSGHVLMQAKPVTAGSPGSEQVIDPLNEYEMHSMMQAVTHYGTGAAVTKLGRNDLAGKTGTTSDMVDAWFCGYNHSVVTVAWIGFDHPRSLGHETGATAALPIWMEYMGKVLKGVPEENPPVPASMIPNNGILPFPGQQGDHADALQGDGGQQGAVFQDGPAADSFRGNPVAPATPKAPTPPVVPAPHAPAAPKAPAALFN